MLVLTQGDPAGIAPEITAKAWHALREQGPAFVWVGDPALLEGLAPVSVIDDPAQARAVFADALPVMPLSLAVPAVPGQPDRRNAAAILESIRRAVALVQAGAADAVVTNPISKDVVQGPDFTDPGHTSFLAELCGAEGREVMMLAGPSLRVVPVTVHVALRKAIEQLTAARIVEKAPTVAAGLPPGFGLGPAPPPAGAGG